MRSALLLAVVASACIRPPRSSAPPVAPVSSDRFSAPPATSVASPPAIGTSPRPLTPAIKSGKAKPDHGSWPPSNPSRWRGAIENYVSVVKPGNQVPLGALVVPFASYVNGMHKRLHPVFSDWFLDSLDSLPESDAMNDPHLVAQLEIVLTQEGRLKQIGIVKTSGVYAFDIAALDSVDRAQTFGPAPPEIVSPDGNVYARWEFHRDEVFGCSPMGSRPFVLRR
jgi:TonB family protein